MKLILKNITSAVLLFWLLPYTVILLANGRAGIGKEELLPELEYQVIDRLLSQDLSQMEDEMLEILAILHRTEIMRTKENPSIKEDTETLYGTAYQRIKEAVCATKGQVVLVDGDYKELPYHAVSAGSVRDGKLLGEGFSYLTAVECPDDKESDRYFQMICLTEEEISRALHVSVKVKDMTLERDEQGYVTVARCAEESFSGEWIRERLHLPSSCFWMHEEDGTVRVTVKGYGHGFGMSLYTADRMIKNGYGYEAVFQKFYQNAECITIP